MVPLGFGTQTAASLIRPASYCGVVGCKASYGVHSLAGIKPLSHSLDTLGWMTRTVDDIELVRSAVSLHDFEPLPEIDGLSPIRIGICHTPGWSNAEEATVTTLEQSGALFTKGGAKVNVVTLPKSFTYLSETQKTITAYEAARISDRNWSRGNSSIRIATANTATIKSAVIQ